MAKSKQESVEDLIRALIGTVRTQTIVQLRLAGVPQREIRNIVGGDITPISRILKCLNKAGAKNGFGEG